MFPSRKNANWKLALMSLLEITTTWVFALIFPSGVFSQTVCHIPVAPLRVATPILGAGSV